MQNNKYYKIYSRARFNLPIFKNTPKSCKSRKKLKKISPLLIIVFIAILTCLCIWGYINPIFETLCQDRAKSVATIITNEETTKAMNKYNYENFFTVEKNENNKIQMINANVLKINQITSEIAIDIQKSLDNSEKNKIYISSGALTGIRLLSGSGPKIGIRLAACGNVETDLRSEFVSKGVNQTVHRVYLNIKTRVNILTTIKTMESSIENQVLIAEHVIVGEIPSTYYNLEGANGEEALRLIE